MRVLWAVCACAACVVTLAAMQMADFPVLVVVTAVLTLALAWL